MPRHTTVAFTWEMLIAPGAALAGVGLTLYATSIREKVQFERQRATALIDRRRDTYAAYLSASDVMAQRVRRVLTDMSLGAWVTRDPTEAEIASVQLGVDQVAELRRARSVLELDGHQEVVVPGLELYAAHARLDAILEPALNRKGEVDLGQASEAVAKIEEARSAFVACCREQIDP
jgi:hypothetical protein